MKNLLLIFTLIFSFAHADEATDNYIESLADQAENFHRKSPEGLFMVTKVQNLPFLVLESAEELVIRRSAQLKRTYDGYEPTNKTSIENSSYMEIYGKNGLVGYSINYIDTIKHAIIYNIEELGVRAYFNLNGQIITLRTWKVLAY